MAPDPVLPTSDSEVSSRQDAPIRKSFLTRIRDDVSLTHADIPVLLCAFVSGLCDSVAFTASSVFASMQTGNTLFLALGASSLPANAPDLWLKALCSIGAFLLGVFAFSQTRRVNPHRKATLGGSFLAQAVFIWAAAALAQGNLVPTFGSLELAEQHTSTETVDMKVVGPLVLLAFQFGGQIVTSRILGFNEVPTTVLTSVYCDLMSDPKLLAPLRKNVKRNRRFASVVLLLSGGIVGGWLSRSKAGMSAALWLAGAVKFGIAVAWITWKGKGDNLVQTEKV